MVNNRNIGYALVTGASSGIGKSFAKQLAQKGYGLILVARREEKLNQVAKEINNSNSVDIKILVSDLSKQTAPGKIYAEVRRLGLEVVVLVNCAGFATASNFLDSKLTEQTSLINVMVAAPMQLCHYFAPKMKEQGHGFIINVSSLAAFTPELPGNLYNAAKSYVVHMTEALDLELKPYGVNCLALCPGLTESEFHDTMGIKELLDIVPKWRWMSADKVAEEGLFAVEKGKYVLVNGKLNKVLVEAYKHMPQRFRYFLGSKGIIL